MAWEEAKKASAGFSSDANALHTAGHDLSIPIHTPATMRRLESYFTELAPDLQGEGTHLDIAGRETYVPQLEAVSEDMKRITKTMTSIHEEMRDFPVGT